MSNKLQELTDRLYNEGLSKGKEEGEILLFKAAARISSIRNSADREKCLTGCLCIMAVLLR